MTLGKSLTLSKPQFLCPQRREHVSKIPASQASQGVYEVVKDSVQDAGIFRGSFALIAFSWERPRVSSVSLVPAVQTNTWVNPNWSLCESPGPSSDSPRLNCAWLHLQAGHPTGWAVASFHTSHSLLGIYHVPGTVLASGWGPWLFIWSGWTTALNNSHLQTQLAFQGRFWVCFGFLVPWANGLVKGLFSRVWRRPSGQAWPWRGRMLRERAFPRETENVGLASPGKASSASHPVESLPHFPAAVHPTVLTTGWQAHTPR